MKKFLVWSKPRPFLPLRSSLQILDVRSIARATEFALTETAFAFPATQDQIVRSTPLVPAMAMECAEEEETASVEPVSALQVNEMKIGTGKSEYFWSLTDRACCIFAGYGGGLCDERISHVHTTCDGDNACSGRGNPHYQVFIDVNKQHTPQECVRKATVCVSADGQASNANSHSLAQMTAMEM